jgi:hypothetical protein
MKKVNVYGVEMTSIQEMKQIILLKTKYYEN